MPTYLDLASLGPTPDLAEARCRSLNLSGILLPELWRYTALRQLGDGDTVVCGFDALDFWRKLSSSARLSCIQTPDEADALPMRFDSWLEWALVQQGVSRGDARLYAYATPPKTPKHTHWLRYQTAVSMASVMEFDAKRVTPIPGLPTIVVDTGTVEVERPYDWTLVDNDSVVHIVAARLAEWKSMFAAGDVGPVGLDVETDVVLDHPNEMQDKLVGLALAFRIEACLSSDEGSVCTSHDVGCPRASVADAYRTARGEDEARDGPVYALQSDMEGVSGGYALPLDSTPSSVALAFPQEQNYVEDIPSSARHQADESSIEHRLRQPHYLQSELCDDTGDPLLGLQQSQSIRQRQDNPQGKLIGDHACSHCNITGGICQTTERADCYYGNITYAPWAALLHQWLPRLSWTGHGAKYDRSVLRAHGFPTGVVAGDSLLAAYLLGIPEAGLKKLVWSRYQYRMTTYAEVVGEGKNRKPISEIDPQVVADYCCGDAYWAQRILPDLLEELEGSTRDLYGLDLRLVEIIGDMQAVGVDFDRGLAENTLSDLRTTNDQLGVVLDQLASKTGYERPPNVRTCKECRNGKVKKLTCLGCQGVGQWQERQPFNPGAPTQVADWLHSHLGLPVQRVSEKTRQPSVDALSLLRLRSHHVAPTLLLQWKQNEKHIGYLESWLEWSADSKLHSVITLSRTRSGRLSSEDPNLQQVKLDWRRAFVAPDGGLLLAADYGQIEVRIPAKMSGDPGLVKAMCATPNTIDGDLHGRNVLRLFGVPYTKQSQAEHRPLRTRAKNYMFGALYGSEGKEVQGVLEKQLLQADTLGVSIPSVSDIHRDIMMLRDEYPDYFHVWVPAALEKCRERGGWVYTLYGRPRYLPDIRSSDKYLRKHAERQCINHMIQGTAADIMRFALIGVNEYCQAQGLWLVLTVHDELVVAIPAQQVQYAEDHKREIVTIMELGQPLAPIPLTVDATLGVNWWATHK